MTDEEKRETIIPSEYTMNFPGLCAYCILNLNANSVCLIGEGQREMAREYLGYELHFPRIRESLKFGTGLPIGPGPMLSELALALGPGLQVRDYQGNKPLFAVTLVNGTFVCEWHCADVITNGRHRLGR